jgi:hypothetical protein
MTRGDNDRQWVPGNALIRHVRLLVWITIALNASSQSKSACGGIRASPCRTPDKRPRRRTIFGMSGYWQHARVLFTVTYVPYPRASEAPTACRRTSLSGKKLAATGCDDSGRASLAKDILMVGFDGEVER